MKHTDQNSLQWGLAEGCIQFGRQRILCALRSIRADDAVSEAVETKWHIASHVKREHLPPPNSEAYRDANLRDPNPPHALKLKVVPIDKIGTDPAEAVDFATRKVEVPAALGLTTNEFGPALGEVVRKAVAKWYSSQVPKISDAERNEMNGGLPDHIRTPRAYKARPLDGIWATAPYLHNGSVPTLDALLRPVAERPRHFSIGSREFDPINVGLDSEAVAGGTDIDTSKRGNLNTGHEFEDAPAGTPGVIGRKLSGRERQDLIEFLKTL